MYKRSIKNKEGNDDGKEKKDVYHFKGGNEVESGDQYSIFK